MRQCQQCNAEFDGIASKVFCTDKCKSVHDHKKYSFARCQSCLKILGADKLEFIGKVWDRKHNKPSNLYVCHKCMDEQTIANKQTDVEDAK